MNLSELLKFLRESGSAEEIDEKREEIAELIPAVRRMFDYDQKVRQQCFDLWSHSIHSVARLPKDLPDDMPNNLLYLAALLHDIGKPDTCSEPKKTDGDRQYEGHCERGVEILEQEILPFLAEKGDVLDEKDVRCLKYYIGHHHEQPARMKRFMRRQMKITTFEQLINLMHLEIADCKSQYKCHDTEIRVELSEYVLKKADEDIVTLFTPAKWII